MASSFVEYICFDLKNKAQFLQTSLAIICRETDSGETAIPYLIWLLYSHMITNVHVSGRRVWMDLCVWKKSRCYLVADKNPSTRLGFHWIVLTITGLLLSVMLNPTISLVLVYVCLGTLSVLGIWPSQCCAKDRWVLALKNCTQLCLFQHMLVSIAEKHNGSKKTICVRKFIFVVHMSNVWVFLSKYAPSNKALVMIVYAQVVKRNCLYYWVFNLTYWRKQNW